MNKYIILETERLYLREMTPSDHAALEGQRVVGNRLSFSEGFLASGICSRSCGGM